MTIAFPRVVRPRPTETLLPLLLARPTDIVSVLESEGYVGGTYGTVLQEDLFLVSREIFIVNSMLSGFAVVVAGL